MKPLVARMILTTFALLVSTVGYGLADPIYFRGDFSFDRWYWINNDANAQIEISRSTPDTPYSTSRLYSAEAGGSTDLIPAILTAVNWGDGPGVFTSQPLTLTLTLTDVASNAQGTLTFPGTLTGEIGKDSAVADFSFTPSIQSLLLGNNLYKVDLTSSACTWIQPSQRWGEGAFDPNFIMGPLVSVETTTAPEPASLTLAGFGIVGLLGCAWRRKLKPA